MQLQLECVPCSLRNAMKLCQKEAIPVERRKQVLSALIQAAGKLTGNGLHRNMPGNYIVP